MPSRILREGILDSRAVNSLSDQGEILYRRLMSVADDFGRFTANPDLIRARCFPLQLDRWPPSRISEALSEISDMPADDGQTLVILYEVSGKRFLEISKFDQRLRLKISKFPDPHTETSDKCPSGDSQMTGTGRLEVESEVEVESEEIHAQENGFTLTPKETNARTSPDNAGTIRSDVPPIDSLIREISQKIHDRHPAGPDGDKLCGTAAVHKSLTAILRKEKLKGRDAAERLRGIDNRHAGWCASESWSKDGCRFARSLEKWMAPTMGRFDEEPPARSRTPAPPLIPAIDPAKIIPFDPFNPRHHQNEEPTDLR